MKWLLFLLLLGSLAGYGQRRIDVDVSHSFNNGGFFQSVNGVPVITNIYFRVVEGSPFYGGGWMRGSVAVDKERGYSNLHLKLDLVANQLHFRDVKGNELICETPLFEVALKDSLTGKTAHFSQVSTIPGLTGLKPDVWVEVLAYGPAQLFAHHKKTISEFKPYGSATVEQRILTSMSWFFVYEQRTEKVKRVSDIVKLLPANKKAAAAEWIKNNSVSDRSPDDMARLVSWFNETSK